jgi:ABC-type transport system involved in multi-copper enzyme maturation permease subunit
MKWLFWKDYRQNRPIVVAAVLFLLVPHLFALYAGLWEMYHQRQGMGRWNSNALFAAVHWKQYFFLSSAFGLILAQLIVAVIGGNAFAGERVDRSAEFLASLPVSRRRIIVSKLLFAAAVVGAIWLIDGAPVAWMAHHSSLSAGSNVPFFLQFIGWTAVVATVFFGVAWLLSSFLASPTLAVFGGLVVPVALWAGFLFVEYLIELHLGHTRFFQSELRWTRLTQCYAATCLTLALASFVAGTWYYLRRVEP